MVERGATIHRRRKQARGWICVEPERCWPAAVRTRGVTGVMHIQLTVRLSAKLGLLACSFSGCHDNTTAGGREGHTTKRHAPSVLLLKMGGIEYFFLFKYLPPFSHSVTSQRILSLNQSSLSLSPAWTSRLLDPRSCWGFN